MRQGKIESDREQQEDDAKFGKNREFRNPDRRPYRVRTENHPHEQIPQAGRDMQPQEGHHDDQRHAQKQEDLREMLHHGLDCLIQMSASYQLHRIPIRVSQEDGGATRSAPSVGHVHLFQPLDEGLEVRHAQGKVIVPATMFRTAGPRIGVGQLHQVELLALAQRQPRAGEAKVRAVQRLETEHILIEASGAGSIGNQDADVMEGEDGGFGGHGKPLRYTPASFSTTFAAA